MTVSNTSSLKSPSGSSSSTSLSISTISGGARSGSEDCGRLLSDGCRKGISVYCISIIPCKWEEGGTADVYVPVVDSGSFSIITLAMVFVVWVCELGWRISNFCTSTYEYDAVGSARVSLGWGSGSISVILVWLVWLEEAWSVCVWVFTVLVHSSLSKWSSHAAGTQTQNGSAMCMPSKTRLVVTKANLTSQSDLDPGSDQSDQAGLYANDIWEWFSICKRTNCIVW